LLECKVDHDSDLKVFSGDKPGEFVGQVSSVDQGQPWSQNITDTAVTVSEPDQFPQLDGLLRFAPNISKSDIASVKFGNIGVKGNQGDSTGYGIIQLIGKDGQVLASIAKWGWGFSLCEKNN
jgi:hypothetical protein